jgi:hypothetical protein
MRTGLTLVEPQQGGAAMPQKPKMMLHPNGTFYFSNVAGIFGLRLLEKFTGP